MSRRQSIGMGYNFDEKEPDYKMTLEDAARQALWDLQQWVKDHPPNCECFTCGESIPDLKHMLPEDQLWGV